MSHVSYADFAKTAEGARNAMTALSKSALDLGLDKGISELVKLRVSQINGCAFCIAFHLKVLRGLHVPQAKLDMLPVWHEAPEFSDAERAALGWAEEMTAMAEAAPAEESREALAPHFSREQIMGLNISIAGINAWNRMAVAFGFTAAEVP
ncbi:MAG TPA: carboxymuconolactone decarboxylase family protein [Rhizomicrobium sp.]